VADFAHPVEAELAALLEEHGIRWEYEPHRFEIEGGEFVPDFYLPDVGVYVECTVGNGRRLQRKRRKAKLARERYGIIVGVLDRRDFERLDVLWVDVDDGGETGAAHGGGGGGEEAPEARRDSSRLGRLRQQLGAVTAPEP
jgi:hypothetical protein